MNELARETLKFTMERVSLNALIDANYLDPMLLGKLLPIRYFFASFSILLPPSAILVGKGHVGRALVESYTVRVRCRRGSSAPSLHIRKGRHETTATGCGTGRLKSMTQALRQQLLWKATRMLSDSVVPSLPRFRGNVRQKAALTPISNLSASRPYADLSLNLPIRSVFILTADFQTKSIGSPRLLSSANASRGTSLCHLPDG